MKYIILLFMLLSLLGCEEETEYVNPISKVQNIQVTRVNSTTSAIDWETHEDDEIDGYYIYRSSSYVGLYELRTTRTYEETLFVDNTAMYDIENGIWVYYKISAFKYEGEYTLEGQMSDIYFEEDMNPISKVQNIQVHRVNATTSAIDWDTHEDEEVDGYKIYRSFYYDGLFEFRFSIAYPHTLFIDNTAFYDGEHGIWSYYKMSAFKYDGDFNIIEGQMSDIYYHGDDN